MELNLFYIDGKLNSATIVTERNHHVRLNPMQILSAIKKQKLSADDINIDEEYCARSETYYVDKHWMWDNYGCF